MGSAVHLSGGAINIVKREPSAVSIQPCLHVLFLAAGFIAGLILFAALFKCLHLQMYDPASSDVMIPRSSHRLGSEVLNYHKRTAGH